MSSQPDRHSWNPYRLRVLDNTQKDRPFDPTIDVVGLNGRLDGIRLPLYEPYGMSACLPEKDVSFGRNQGVISYGSKVSLSNDDLVYC